MELEKSCKQLLIKNPFYGIFLLHLNKYYTDTIPTAAVNFCGINPELMVNKEFWDTLTDEEQLGVLTHELLHLVFKHPFSGKLYNSHARFNAAADCEVNSYIPVLQKEPYLFPKRFDLYNLQGTDYYYKYLPEDIEDSFDDHSGWKVFSELDDATKKLINNQIDNITKETVNACKGQGIGNLPGKVRAYIEELFTIKKQIFNWRAYFRRLVGNGITSDLILTKMRPSKRFEDARGLRNQRKPKILVGIDTSGSISDKHLCDFFSEIYHIWKTGVRVTVAQIDTCINHIEEYKGTFDKKVYGRGGTKFTDLFNYYNEHRRDFSMLIIFTDGYVNLNLPKTKNTIWIITKNGKKQDYPGKTIYIPND